MYWRVTEKTVASRLPAALAYKLIRRGCSPADLATLAMLWPRGGHVPQQTKAGRAIKPGQGASNLAPPLQPLPGASPPAGGDQCFTAGARRRIDRSCCLTETGDELRSSRSVFKL